MASASSDAPPLLTVIVPVFNEAATIDELLRRVTAEAYPKQIIVVDDGSTDGTSTVLCAWQSRSYVEVVRHDRNRGKGRAIRTALERARGRFVIIQDGDLETDPQDYSALLEPLLEGCADFVIGNRFAGGANSTKDMGRAFRVGVRLLNLTVRLLYGVYLSDEACCYKVLPTHMLKAMNLQCERFEFCPEVVAKASRMGLRITEVPIRYDPRCTAAGKKIRYRDGVHAAWQLWKLRDWNPCPPSKD